MKPNLILYLVLVLSSFFCHETYADIGMLDSVEWLTAMSDQIGVYRAEQIVSRNSTTNGGSIISNYTGNFKLQTSLRGNPPPTFIRDFCKIYAITWGLSTWSGFHAGDTYIFFFVDEGRRNKVRDHAGISTPEIFFSSGSEGDYLWLERPQGQRSGIAIDRNGMVLTNRQDILKLVETSLELPRAYAGIDHWAYLYGSDKSKYPDNTNFNFQVVWSGWQWKSAKIEPWFKEGGAAVGLVIPISPVPFNLLEAFDKFSDLAFFKQRGDEAACYVESLHLKEQFPLFTNRLAQKDFSSANYFYTMLRFRNTNSVFTPEQYMTSALLLAHSLIANNQTSGTNQATDGAKRLDVGALNLLRDMFNRDTSAWPGVAQLIPELIEGLRVAAQDHSLNGTANANTLLIMLEALTWRVVGNRISGREFSREPEAVLNWWENWWRENKDRHPIFDDPERARLVYAEASKIAAIIGTATPGFIWDWDLPRPDEINGTPRPLVRRHGNDPIFYFGFLGHCQGFGRRSALYDARRGDDELWINFQFLTEPLPYDFGHPTNSFAKETIFSKTFTNFGMKVTVDLYSTNTVLVKSLRDGFNQ